MSGARGIGDDYRRKPSVPVGSTRRPSKATSSTRIGTNSPVACASSAGACRGPPAPPPRGSAPETAPRVVASRDRKRRVRHRKSSPASASPMGGAGQSGNRSPPMDHAAAAALITDLHTVGAAGQRRRDLVGQVADNPRQAQARDPIRGSNPCGLLLTADENALPNCEPYPTRPPAGRRTKRISSSWLPGRGHAPTGMGCAPSSRSSNSSRVSSAGGGSGGHRYASVLLSAGTWCWSTILSARRYRARSSQ